VPDLTYEQTIRKTERQSLNYQRQAMMPLASRPRISPRDNMPKPHHGVTKQLFASCRVCIEHPSDHPNDFLYLYRRVAKLNRPEFFWLDAEGKNRGTQKTYPSIYAALAPYIRAGWLDASW
jgi:hypothetical protein